MPMSRLNYLALLIYRLLSQTSDMKLSLFMFSLYSQKTQILGFFLQNRTESQPCYEVFKYYISLFYPPLVLENIPFICLRYS